MTVWRKFGELDVTCLKTVQEQKLQQRFIREPVDLNRAVNYDILTEVDRTSSNDITHIEP
jgi:hypothetical protein